ncbi:MAG TPA: polysaccharide deacetylase family protein [Candidatus Omnitrophota bacterium]|jgi:peptidoglycan/xylan/chitin deacetylase (PgdA/CDA1 family)|nr:polysaccharide deacetylase family protein [Candidatus Omnitrophota bacterium]HQB94836.1 polysaccharide deacetylase family protein [Candidatus Omnitrophota bacterium]
MDLKPIVTAWFFISMALTGPIPRSDALPAEAEAEDYKVLKEIILLEFSGEKPHETGPLVPGVKTRIRSSDKVMAVTFNACGRTGGEFDSALLDLLEKESVPATFFVSGIWLEKNPELAKRIAATPLFEIANLGLEARSCLVAPGTGADAPATRNVEEVFAEIEKNARKIEAVTGALPHFFRSAPSHYDDIAVRIARALGYDVVGTGIRPENSTRGEFAGALLRAAAGSIATFSASDAGTRTSILLRETIPQLRAKGFRFVKLRDYPLE